MDIEIADVVKGVAVESMTTKSIRGVTEDGVTIYEDDLQLKLKNVGKRSFSEIDCKVEYSGSGDAFLGFDESGVFKEIKPGQHCLISVPLIIPKNTKNKKLSITGEKKEGFFSKHGYWVFLLVCFIFVVVSNLRSGD